MSRYDPRDEGDDEIGGDELEADIMRADHAFGAELAGTTSAEAVAGQGLDRALARERPERTATDEVLSVLDEGIPDVEGDLVSDVVLERDEFASPEEVALSVRDSVPGATDHADQHGVVQDHYDED